MAETFERYNARWPVGMEELQVEMECVKRGGQWKGTKSGKIYGLGRSHHLSRMRQIIWPELDDERNGQRWHKLCRETICSHKVTVLMGCASSGKTHEAAWIYLCEWMADPENTVVLVSSTDLRGLKLRVWGEITSLWERAVERFDYLPGHLLDSATAITFSSLDDIEEGERKVRDMRQAIIGIPTVQGGKSIGLSKWQGIKQKKVRLIADEAACFPAGQMVETISGPRAIEQIKVGEYVRNAVGFGRVKELHTRKHPQLVRIKSRDGREFICTPSHPIFTNNGWKCASHLNQSDYMLGVNEAMCVLQSDVPSNFAPDHVQPLSKHAKNLRVLQCAVYPKESTRKDSILREEMQIGLGGKDCVLRQDMHSLRGGLQGDDEKRVLRTVQGTYGEPEVQGLRGGLHGRKPKLNIGVLRSLLLVEMEHDAAGISGQVLHEREGGEDYQKPFGDVSKKPGTIPANARGFVERHGEVHGIAHARGKENPPIEHEQNPQGARTQAPDSRRQRDGANQGRVRFVGDVSRGDSELSGEDRHESWEWLSNVLQGGLGLCENKTRRRGGRCITPASRPKGAGREEDQLADGSWVDSCEIYEQENLGRHGEREAGVAVYNLEVEGHPSYTVAGFLVHNCMNASFLSAFSNLNNNASFECVVLGNPSDISDPLGKAAEPIDGWDGHMQPEKTSVWKTRFMNGACVNLIGTDSPNFDFPEDEPTRFKYLISREKIASTTSFFPKDSFEYYSMCVGSMKIATLSTAVLTRRLCEQNKAFDQNVVWNDSNRTRVYFVDAAYGSDRCVGGMAEFGKDLNGQVILLYQQPVIIPILANVDQEPEAQIAAYIKKECEANNIPPENMGHDATGRGSLGTFIARVWSAQTHPVESGGAPTDRPMSLDLFVIDPKTKERRLKTCKEGYSKRVTEFWFSVRYAVQAGQIRGLTEDTVEEFRLRKWKRVGGDRIELESKDDMKERIGRSPDLADWAAGIVEMARRKGFQISKLANTEPETKSNQWLRDLAVKNRAKQQASTLNYA